MHHPRAGDGLEQRLDALALAESVQDGGHRAGVKPIDAVKQHVARHAVQLAEDYADMLRPLRRLDAHQLLHRHAHGELAVEIRHIIQPVEQRDYLAVLLPLAQLLGAAVQVADMRLRAHNALAIHPYDEPKHPVRGRVLRPHVDHQIDGVRLFGWLLMRLHSGAFLVGLGIGA